VNTTKDLLYLIHHKWTPTLVKGTPGGTKKMHGHCIVFVEKNGVMVVSVTFTGRRRKVN